MPAIDYGNFLQLSAFHQTCRLMQGLGLMVKKKNCEKCGSCAFTKKEMHKKVSKIQAVFFICYNHFRILKISFIWKKNAVEKGNK